MTRIDFYVNSDNPLVTLGSLSVKALRQGARLFVFTRDIESTERVDRHLWTQPAIGFVPHCRASHRLAPVTPIIVDHLTDSVVHEEVLVNMADDCAHLFSRFERLIEIVGQDEEAKLLARGRFRFYRDRGYDIHTHDLAKTSEP